MKGDQFQRVFGEVVFPLFGIVFWNWTLDFVCWFYCIDQFVKMVFLLFFTPKKEGDLNGKTFGVSLWLFCEVLMILCILFLQSKDLSTSFQDFFFFKDMGIAQGYFLFPLVILGEYMKVKMDRKQNREAKSQSNERRKLQQLTYFKICFWGILIAIICFQWVQIHFLRYILIAFLALSHLLFELRSRFFSRK
jgi:hypothetical protein